MNSELVLFAVGSLLTWLSLALAARAVYCAVQYAFQVPGVGQATLVRGFVVNGVLAAVGLVAGGVLAPGPALRLPLVWLIMPFFGWLIAASLGMIVFRGVQAWLSIAAAERKDRLSAAGIWLLVLVVCLWLFKRDPLNAVTIIKGAIPLSVATGLALALIVLASIVAMAASARWATGRGFVKGAASQIALIAGSVVFGLPFVFLVITSFKEDRDMSSSSGIVWIPKVQETVAYNDPKNPLYAGSYEGVSVLGTIIERHPDRVRVSIEQPMSELGRTFETTESSLKPVPRQAKLVTGKLDGTPVEGEVIEDLDDGGTRVQVLTPASLKGRQHIFGVGETEPVRHVGLRWQNYTEALSFMPPETDGGLVYVKNTLLIVIFSVVGTILSSSIVAYAFSRMKFPGKNVLFAVLLSTMMLPAAVTMLPQFLIFRSLGWIDTLYPLWVPAFFASAFNVFLLRQFFMQIPMELEDAAKIDGASYLKTFWTVMLPQIKPALAVIAIWTFMGAWNNFMGPLIYINSPEHMPLAYALQLFQGDRSGEPGLLMAFVTMTVIPVLLLFFFAQRYFIEGVTLSGFGGR